MGAHRIEDLFRHMEWADSVVWAEVLRRPDTAIDGRLRELLHHVHSVHWAYLQIWSGEAIEVPELDTFEDAEAVRAWGRAFYGRAPELLGRFEAEGLDGTVELPWADRLVERFGEVRPVTMEETALQVILHSTYHRGQANARLRELGGEPPLTDYVAWLWAGRPEPAWERAGSA